MAQKRSSKKAAYTIPMGKGVSLNGAGCSSALLEYVSQNESSPS
jgi:hypothetical protein